MIIVDPSRPVLQSEPPVVAGDRFENDETGEWWEIVDEGTKGVRIFTRKLLEQSGDDGEDDAIDQEDASPKMCKYSGRLICGSLNRPRGIGLWDRRQCEYALPEGDTSMPSFDQCESRGYCSSTMVILHRQAADDPAQFEFALLEGVSLVVGWCKKKKKLLTD